MSVILSLRDLEAGFGDKPVLANINLEVTPGSILAIMGPGKAGKSTLVRTLCGINQVDRRFWWRGQATYLEQPLGTREWPAIALQHPSDLGTSLSEYLSSALPERSTLTLKQQKAVCERLLERAGLERLINKTDRLVADFDMPTRKLLSVLRAVTPGPRLLCVDEPVHGLEDEDARPILDFLRDETERRSIILVTHNQKWAREYADFSGLLAGGRIQELKKTDEFFNNPGSELIRIYIRTGGCPVPSLSARPEDIDREYSAFLKPPPVEPSSAPETPISETRRNSSPHTEKAPDKAVSIPSEMLGPSGFHWVIPGALAGAPRPGVVSELRFDLAALDRVGVTHAICLLEEWVLADSLQDAGITSAWFPIVDMEAPELEDAAQLCLQLEDRMSSGDTVLLFCKAGLGRTGTMAAAQLVFRGASGLEAIERARQIEPRWIQSERQEEFLVQFERYLISHPPKSTGRTP